jgi:hypothetical protein
MNNLVKTAVAGALALAATSTFAIGVPSSNSSDLILYVDALTSTGSSAGVYALDTGVSLSSLMPGPYVSGAANSTVFAGITKSISPSSTLTSFLGSHPGDSFGWTLEGGQYNNPGYSSGSPSSASNFNSVAPGSALAIFTSQALTNAFPKVSTAVTGSMQDFLNGINNDLSSGNLTALLTATETGSASETLGAPSKYGFFGGSDLASVGSTAITLFGFTGNGVNGGTLQSYILGSATLGADGTLQINPNSGGGGGTAPVPLPAAVWLFGSGLMGLAGVSRRRKGAAESDSLVAA